MSHPHDEQSLIPLRRQSVTAHRLDGETVLYDITHHEVHYLNATATTIWDCCDGETNLDGITNALAATFELPPAVPDARSQLSLDVKNTLVTMAENGLIDFCDKVVR